MSSSLNELIECRKICKENKNICQDSPEAIACFNCALECSITLDRALRSCLYDRPRTILFTQEYSHCESRATQDHKICMNQCSSNNVID